MKFSVVRIEPLAVRPDDAAHMLDLSANTFQMLIKCGWLAPSVHEHRLTLYDVEHVRKVWERIKREGSPK